MIVMAISDHRAVMWFGQHPDETYVQNYWENLLTTLARPLPIDLFKESNVLLRMYPEDESFFIQYPNGFTDETLGCHPTLLGCNTSFSRCW